MSAVPKADKGEGRSRRHHHGSNDQIAAVQAVFGRQSWGKHGIEAQAYVGRFDFGGIVGYESPVLPESYDNHDDVFTIADVPTTSPTTPGCPPAIVI